MSSVTPSPSSSSTLVVDASAVDTPSTASTPSTPSVVAAATPAATLPANTLSPFKSRNDPDAAVRALDRILTRYPPDELAGETVWLDQWRE
jgi:hypothetical protein